MRRLPVYLVLDCSESMIGEPIEAVQTGMERLVRELRQDPHALETVHVSIITFSSRARQVLPLTELLEVQTPQLKLGPGTALGAALRLLRQCIDREVRPTTRERKGDYLPLVFLLTDGLPTDAAEEAIEAVEEGGRTRLGNLYCIGCGEDVDYTALHRIADAVFQLDEMSEEQIRSLFMWLTASVQSASVAVTDPSSGPTPRVDLSKKPDTVEEVPKARRRAPNPHPRVMILKGVCSEHEQPYLMRYIRAGGGVYRPVSAHVVDEELFETEDDGLERLAPIRSSSLNGVPCCALCGNPGAGACGNCNTLFCLPAMGPPVVRCPGCKAEIGLGPGSGDFDIHQRSD